MKANPHRSLVHQFLLPLVLLGALCANAGAQGAKKAVFERLEVKQLESMMDEEGYAVSIDADGDILWKIEGASCYILVAADKESLLFKVAFSDTDTTLEAVNRWNQTVRYSRSYLDEDDDPVLELDLDLVGGVTRERIYDFLKTCRASFDAWHDEVLD